MRSRLVAATIAVLWVDNLLKGIFVKCMVVYTVDLGTYNVKTYYRMVMFLMYHLKK